MHPDLSLARVLAKVTAGTAVALGLLILAAGLGLGFALLTSAQLPLQFATAAVLLVTGAVNLASSRGLWKENRRALAASGATATLVAYLAALGDFGELLIYHALYLLLLAALACQRRSISAVV
jgi:hypothetical protein